MTTKTGSLRRRSAVAAITSALLIATVGWASPVVRAGSTISVSTIQQEVNDDADCSLQEAIFSANYDDNIAPDTIPGTFFDTGCEAGSGDDKIVLLPPAATFTMAGPINDQFNYVGPTATPIVTSTILIEGLGATLVHGGGLVPYRAFAVSNTGNLHLREVEIRGFEVQGGHGANGGGGGMGAGGAVYVHNGTLMVELSTFVQNGALGGDGGGRREVAAAQDFDIGGGGGGLGGNGGSAGLGGGGGGGARGDGGSGNVRTCDGGFFDCAFGFGGGGGGTIAAGSNGSSGSARGGFECGGAGAGTQFGDGGHGAGCRGGGGGGGNAGLVDWDQDGLPDPYLGDGGDGGDGEYGGGGGGGGWGSTPILGRGSDGGDGGFGGGGGGAGGDTSSGGDSDFGGGGGAGAEGDFNIGGNGQGGMFAGDGGGFYGGGGAGLGGAIFGHVAHIEVLNSTFVTNYANRGHYGGGDANDGRGAGGAIFTAGGTLIVTSSTFHDNQTGEWGLDDDGKVVGLGGGAIVVYDPVGTTEAFLILRNSLLAANGPFPCYTRNDVGTGGSGGNLVTNSAANSQGDPACAGVAVTADPGLQALALNKPGRTRTMKIPTTSSAADRAVVATSPQIDQRLILRPQGSGPDIGAYESAIIPPVTAITLDPETPDGSNGWYQATVGVTVFASDVDGTVALTRCVLDPTTVPASFFDLPAGVTCPISSVDADGPHVIYAASVDTDGNTEAVTSASFRIDGTPPTLSPRMSTTTVVVGQTGLSAVPNATDAMSGVATSSCGTVDTSTPGTKTVTCTARDNAGKIAESELTYVVEYRILGFFSPVPDSKWKVSQTIPVKVALGNHLGTRIRDAEASALAADCRVTFSAEGVQPKAAQCLKYDPATDQFVFNWKLAKSPTGSATITVTISYPGSTVTTRLSEVITITR